MRVGEWRQIMLLPKIEQQRVDKLFERYCKNRVPPHARDQINMLNRVTGNKVVLIESRPYYDDPSSWIEMPIAQFEYNPSSNIWSLYGYDWNDKLIPIRKGSLEQLIREVDNDPTGIFWG